MATYKELLKQHQELALQVEEARKREIANAVAQVRSIIAEFDLSEKDVFPGSRKSVGSRAGSKVAPKYRDPSSGQTWTGRGKAPKWIEGQNRDQFLIA